VNILNRLLGKNKHQSTHAIADFEVLLTEEAKRQSFEMRLVITKEAKSIGTQSDILQKQNYPADFVDIALQLLAYPSELAYFIAVQFSNYEALIGFNPYGTIIAALMQINSFYCGVMLDTRLLQESPELVELGTSPVLRAEKAGSLLAVALLYSGQLATAKAMYHSATFDLDVKDSVNRKLMAVAPELASTIIQ